jgi:glycosyltransferase involved in cell wall biosynthesis
MRILVIDQFAHIGGGQMCLLDLIPGFRDRGWQVHVALPSDGPFADRLHASGASVDFFGGCTYRQGRKSFQDMLAFPSDIYSQVKHITRLADHHKPDLVYVNGPRVLPAAALAARSAPLLFHAHSHVNQAVSQAIVTRSISSRRAAVVACSQSVAGFYRSRIPASKLAVVPNGVADHGYRARSSNPPTGPRIGMIGRIVPGKGHLLFLECARLLSDRIPGIRFTICGGPEVSEAARGLPVDWLGWREDVAKVLNDLDVLVIPSVIEGLPRVMLEAFSAGVPVVAFPVGGIPEVIRDGETGFLVEQQSAEALAVRLEKILTTGGALQHVSRNARLEWESTYNVDTYRAGVMAVVDRVARQ